MKLTITYLKKNKYIVFAILFALIQTLAILRNVLDQFYNFAWFCDFAPLLFAIFFFMKKTDYVQALAAFGVLAQAIFIFDFIYTWFSGVNLLGTIPNFFSHSIFFLVATFLIHSSSILAIYLTKNHNPNKETLKASIPIIILIYIISITALLSIGQNANYIEQFGKSIPITIPFHTILWPAGSFLFFALPGFGIEYLVWKFFGKKKKSKS